MHSALTLAANIGAVRQFTYSITGHSPGRLFERGSLTQAKTTIGPAIHTGDSSAAGALRTSANDHFNQVRLTPPFTIQAFVSPSNLAGFSYIWCTDQKGSSKAGGKLKGHILYLDNTLQTIALVAHDGTLSALNTGGAFQHQDVSIFAANDNLNIIAATSGEPIDNTPHKLWLNGVALSTTTSGNHITATHGTNALYGGLRDGVYSDSLSIAHVATWNRYLSDGELKILSDDPLAIYRPNFQRRIHQFPPFDIDAGLRTVTTGGAVITSKRVLTG